jgi:hypothetical protein
MDPQKNNEIGETTYSHQRSSSSAVEYKVFTFLSIMRNNIFNVRL